MINYQIKFINKITNINTIISISSTNFILDEAKKKNLILPYSCKTGNCSSCVCKIIKGSIKHSHQTFLNSQDLKNQYFLPCVAYAKSNLIILTNVEDELY